MLFEHVESSLATRVACFGRKQAFLFYLVGRGWACSLVRQCCSTRRHPLALRALHLQVTQQAAFTLIAVRWMLEEKAYK